MEFLCVVVGGFEFDTRKEDIEHTLRHIRDSYTNKEEISDVWCSGKRLSYGKIKFVNVEALWRFLRHFKGQRFKHGERVLWHSKGKSKEELGASRRISAAARAVKRHITEHHGEQSETLLTAVEADWNRGILYWQPQGAPCVRVFERSANDSSAPLRVGPTFASSSLATTYGFDAEAHLPDINAGGR